LEKNANFANFVVFGCFRLHFGSDFDPIVLRYTVFWLVGGKLVPWRRFQASFKFVFLKTFLVYTEN
jgi:hypothetical protein